MSFHRVASDMIVKVGDFGLACQPGCKVKIAKHCAKVPLSGRHLNQFMIKYSMNKTDVVCSTCTQTV